jgi:2'-5' RNA ligase
MRQTARLFVGIDLDPIWTAGLSAAVDELRELAGDAARFVRPELFHVTVVFLGEQDAEGQEETRQAMRAAVAACKPFQLELTEIKILGGHEHGALVAGVADPSGGLLTLRAYLNEELRAHGVRYDAKPLVPHVTLARPKRRRTGPLPIAPLDLTEAPPLQVNAATLVRSFLLPTGPKYESLMKLRLTGG